MVSLMGSKDLHREVGQREKQWDMGQRKGEKERQEQTREREPVKYS